MKRTLILITALAIALGAAAQTDSIAKPTDSADSAGPGCRRVEFSLHLGFSAGVTFFANTWEGSPYYSSYGLTLQVPLVFHFDLSRHWRLATGLGYNFYWDPLVYQVRPSTAADNGIELDPDPHTGHQTALAMHGYLGIPLQFTWYPWPEHRKWLSLDFDVYGGMALTQYITGSTVTAECTDGVTHTSGYVDFTVNDRVSMPRWKLEVGVTLCSDRVGLLHGVRLFGNVLPTYYDVATGEHIRTFGMTLFL